MAQDPVVAPAGTGARRHPYADPVLYSVLYGFLRLWHMASNPSANPIPTLDRAFDLYEGGDPTGAADVCNEILAVDGNNYGALYLLGSLHGTMKDFHNSIVFLRRAIEIDSKRPVAYFNLANALYSSERYVEAVRAIDSYLTLVATNPEAYNVRAAIYFKLRQFEESLRSSERAIELNPDFVQAYNIRGNALIELKRVDEALASYDKAIAFKPDFADAYYNRGNVFRELRRFDKCVENYDKAITLKRDFSGAYYGKGCAHAELKQLEPALSCLENALRLDPKLEFLPGDICHIRQQLCIWSTYASETENLKKRIRRCDRVSQPFPILSISNSNALNKQASQIFITAKTDNLGPPEACERRSKRERIRIGYFSADFHNHATAHLMAGLFERHDKSKFEVIAFSFGPDTGDVIRKRLIAAFNRFIDVRDRSDRQIADLARSLEIDIAIDLKGFTGDNRVEIFAHRAAPIQVNYLGYPGTMAAKFIDYIIADKVLIPESHKSEYSEKVVYLLDSYQPNDASREIAVNQYKRASCSLPEQGFVFCCFNNSYKITPDVFDCWMRVLKQAPDSVLWLFAKNRAAVENLRREAQIRAVDPARLIFATYLPWPEHLARHRLADLFLDTLPYNAHTTASDALWAGLPVLTQIGETFAGRVAASLLTAIGLPELITSSQAEYEANRRKQTRDKPGEVERDQG
jgi:predicted O-linked N-acetylglucosamine transferase (SPINDLY family)